MFGFSTKKHILVSSVVYNMAGDFDPKESYTKLSALSPIVLNKPFEPNFIKSAIDGPYQQKKRFFSWAKANEFFGRLKPTLLKQTSINNSLVQEYFDSVYPDDVVVLNKTFIDNGEITYYADKYLLENLPELRYTNWVADYSVGPTYTITFEDTTVLTIDIPEDFSLSADYLVCYYSLYGNDYYSDTTTGDTIISGTPPDTTNYINISSTSELIEDIELTTTTTISHVYSDHPTHTNYTDVNTVNTLQDFTNTEKVKEATEYLGLLSGETTKTQISTYYESKTYEILVNTETTVNTIDHGSYTETITTTVDTEYLSPVYTYRFDTKYLFSNEKLGEYCFIYKLGSGNSYFDSLIEDSLEDPDDFYPIIPLRLNNRSVSKLDVYNQCKKACKRLQPKMSLDNILDTIDSNESVGDIDYAYLVPGIPLNTESNNEKKYLYLFFKNLMDYQTFDGDLIDDWVNDSKNGKTDKDLYDAWLTAQSDPESILFGTPPPSSKSQKAYTPNFYKIVLKTDGITINDNENDNTYTDNFKYEISWFTIKETAHTGKGKPTAHNGEYWFEAPENSVGDSLSWWEIYQIGAANVTESTRESLDKIDVYLYHQIDNNSYTKLTLRGLSFRNYIYKGKHISVTARKALLDEDVSDFLVPLHKPTLLQMRLCKRNDVVFRCNHLVFNSYKIVKQKWWQSNAFILFVQIVIMIIAIASAVYTFGSSITAATAVIATLEVTVGLYLAITLAVILSAAISYIVQLLLIKTIEEGLKLFLDDKSAKLISTMLVAIATIYVNPTSAITIATNVLTCINALSSYILENAMKDIPELQEEVNALRDKYKNNESVITSTYEELGIDISNDYFDEIIINDLINRLPAESYTDFFNRTTAGVGDLYSANLNITSNFVNRNLQLDNFSINYL